MSLLALIGATGGLAWRAFVGPGPLAEARTVVIPRGGASEVAEALQRAGVVGDRLVFEAAAWLTWSDGPLHAAELAFPARVPLGGVLAILRTGHPVQHLLTIPEGLTARQIAALFGKAEALTGEVEPPPEGSVLPQTYAYEYGTSRRVLLAHAETAMEHALASAWEGRAADLPLTSPQDALTLASIVERETARVDERPHIAAVYLNRLRQGMRLQADPTVAYAVSAGDGVLDRKLSRADLGLPHPYNTYRVTGLPPGPICAPSLASLQAVLHPSASDDLYFVADGTGGHVFARTEEAHGRNVAAWRALGRAPGRGGRSADPRADPPATAQ